MIKITQKPQILLLLCCVNTILIISILFYFGSQWREDWLCCHTAPPKAQKPSMNSDTPQLVATITENHLFGHAIKKVGEVPTTSLQLQVTGIVKLLQNGTAHSKAYISIAGQPSKIVQPGDELPYGVKVYDITAHAVIVENNGRLEKILLPREKLKFHPLENKEQA